MPGDTPVGPPPEYTNAFRRTVFVSPPSLGGDVDDFPVVIELTGDQNLTDNASSDGRDILFMLADGTVLDTEIVLYDRAAGNLRAWVRLPTMIDGVQAVYLYYGDGNVAPARSAPWSDDAELVMHCDDLENNISFDSSMKTNNGTSPNAQAPALSDGVIGSSFDFNDEDVVNFASASVLDAGNDSVTLSMWFQEHSTLNEWDIAFYKGAWDSNTRGFDIELGSSKWSVNVSDGQSLRTADLGDESSLRNGWHHLAMVIDREAGSSGRLYAYLDGEEAESTSLGSSASSGGGSGGAFGEASGPIGSLSSNVIGHLGSGNNSLDGSLDEIRFYRDAMPPEWIAAEAALGVDPGFITVGGPLAAVYPGTSPGPSP